MQSRINALIVPYDSGLQGTRMGSGPQHLVASGVLGSVQERAEVTVFAAAPGMRGEVASAFEIQRWLAQQVVAAREAGAFPLVFAGNCMSAVGIFAGLRARSRRIPGVCWFDAHADFNTPETTVTGFLDGMALATLTGRCWTHLTKSIPDFRPASDDAVLMFGTRDIDALERKALSESAIHFPKARDSERLTAQKVTELRSRVGEIYLHIDLDVLDISEGRANQFACAGGLTRAQLIAQVRALGSQFHIGAAAITAYDPACDLDQRIPPIVREIVETIAAQLG